MRKNKFIQKYYPFAHAVWQKTGFPISSILAQSAIETGWGATVVGNMMFGVKDTDGINGNEQLLVTKEYHNTANIKYPVIIAIKWIGTRYLYTVKDWFRKYETPEQSFADHANFLLKNKRYAKALKELDRPTYFSREIARAGYATGYDYERLFIQITFDIWTYLDKNGYKQ
jgi:flagellar protein FlgJ